MEPKPKAAASDTWTFTVQNYITIPASAAVTPDISKKGFLVRTWKSPGQPGNLAWTEQQLAGQQGDNEADTSVFTDSQFGKMYYDETGAINYWSSGGEANFPNNATQTTPGLANDGSNDDSYSMEILSYVELPAGLVKMGVNSDDGFRVSLSPAGDPRDKLPITLGQFDAGRGVANTFFSFVVEKAAVYAFRTIYFEGGGDAAVEWFSQSADNRLHLINEETDTAAFKSYRIAQGNPYIQSFTTDFTGFKVELADNGSKAVDDKSVTITLDGAAASPAPTVSKAGGVTTISYVSSSPWISGSPHTLGLSFKDTNGNDYSRTSNFTAPLGNIPGSYAAVSADTSKKGFLVRTWHSTGQPNTLAWTEDQLDGKHGANNLAHPEVFADTQFGIKYFDETGVIDYWNSGGEGNFPNNATPNVPGLANDGTNDDNYSLEILTFLDLPAGKVTMGVNSDDGFRVYVLPTGNPADKGIPVGQFDGGRGVADTRFDLTVEKAGIYPFRTIYEEGGGDAAVEWFSVDSSDLPHLINDPVDAASIKAYRAGTVVNVEPPRFSSVKISGGNITVEWTGGGSLQTADTVAGPWVDVPGAASPFSTPATGVSRFARIKR